MKKLLFILAFAYSTGHSQFNRELYHDLLSNNAVVPPPALKSFTNTVIPTSSLDLLTPNRGANTFYSTTQWANIPDPAISTWSLDNQYRFLWALVQTGPTTYNWSDFDNQVNVSIGRKQRFEFRMTNLDTDAPSSYPLPVVGGARLCYPSFLHTQMQAEAVKDWTYNNGTQTTWIPNWNSPSYLTAWQNFCVAVNDHIMNSLFNSVQYRNVISKIDVSGFGNYGEWHSYPFINSYPSTAQKATSATLIRIMDIHMSAYPMWPAMGNIGMWTLNSEIPPDAGYHAFFATNTWGRMGVLNDHFGWTAVYQNDVPNNTRNFNGVVFGQQLQIQYRVAPIAGEPMNNAANVTDGGSCAFWHMETEIRAYHASQFNNQNGTTASGACVSANYLASSKACGYRLQISGGTVSNNFASGTNMQLNCNWANVGIAPNYENWIVRVDLRNAAGTVVWFGQSGFIVKFFQPGTNTFSDTFSIPVLPAGVYSVNVMIQDPTGYRAPLPLYNTGVRADGSYQLTTINII